MHALHQEILAPSGVEFAAWLKLATGEGPEGESVLSNVVVARSNLLRVFELRKITTDNEHYKFYHIRTHRLHGIVTGLEGVRVLGSLDDGRDRLLVAFKDAKIALLEWSPAQHDLITVSIHTYERAPQCLDIKPSFRSLLRVDPVSRCAALLLPQDALAILPFHSSEDHNEMDVDLVERENMPYFPSFILELPQSVSPAIHNIIDFVFLPGFNNPTVALLYNDRPTWTGRLKEAKDTCGTVIFSMSNFSSSWGSEATFSVITSINNLPYDAFAVVPCPAAVGGLIVLTPNAIIYLEATKKLVLPVNGWVARVSDVTLLPLVPIDLDLQLEGSRATFIADTTLLLILVNGDMYSVNLVVDGKAVSGMSISPKLLARTTIPSLVMAVSITEQEKSMVFVASTQGPSTLLRTSMVEESDANGKSDEKMDESNTATVEVGEGVDAEMYDDDADIYGPSQSSGATAKVSTAQELHKPNLLRIRSRMTFQFILADYLPSYGGINDMVFGMTQLADKPTPVLIAATSTSAFSSTSTKVAEMEEDGLTEPGSGLGGFTLFQRDLPVKMKRRMHVLGGSKGKGDKKLTGDKEGGEGWKEIRMIISTDANPNPGFSRMTAVPPSTTKTKTNVASSIPSIANISNSDIISRIQGTTIGAGPIFGGIAVLQVMSGAIRVLEIDGTERQLIKDVESSSSSSTVTATTGTGALSTPSTSSVPVAPRTMPSNARARIRHCSISDPYVMILREDGTMGLFIGEAAKGKVRRKDMSMLGGKTSKYVTGCFFVDQTGVLERNLLSSAVDVGKRTEKDNQWLLLVRPQGIMEIWTLPKMVLAFSVSMPLLTLENVLLDSGEGVASSVSGSALSSVTAAAVGPTGNLGVTGPAPEAQSADATMRSVEETEEQVKEGDESHIRPGIGGGIIDEIEQVMVAPLGESRPELHLFVLLRSGQLAVYKIIPAAAPTSNPQPTTADSTTSPTSQTPSTSLNSQRAHLCVAFVKVLTKTFELSGAGLSAGTSGGGVGSNESSWILCTDHGGVHLYPSGYSVVHAFTPVCSGSSTGESWGGGCDEFLLYSDEGPSLLSWIPGFELDYPLPMRSIPLGRPYSNVVFDPSTSLVVAAAVMEARFASFDEEGGMIWEKDAPNIADPTTECSTLELISPDLWVSMDGYEFATNEVVNAVACVSLETASTDTGSKEFIVVGTTINRGEDLAAKGATYIFEIVEVVPDPTLAPKRWYKLRLRCRDDAKGPVTALCALNGYLVSSMGQKIFVRAFDSDERLVGVAFMDVGVYVTSLRTIKNLLLIGDAVKSVSFVAFQEDPYKLVLLAKDPRHLCVTTADFFFADNEMAIFTHDEDGIMRLYDYNPHDPDSGDGRYLLLRSEFNTQNEYRTTALIARRTSPDDVIPQAKLLCGAANGSIAAITPVDETVAKSLQLLQGQLTRNIQHVAGLNPRALRIVRNDYVSKPLSKGILDGSLLVHFGNSSTTRQTEMTKQIGTEVEIVRRHWMTLDGPW
ncbi:CPSF A subunit region-domain-containing protein [Rhodocollybia butyracea]|uniref:CPSF A subunit region-domain-containing protein n=1 Tax=Rhodocollybia butyracea TaxID=206335 RepID=A0A9P5QBB1_9AGAR|nr:CPSF A subunit region-domain-containing protein [Rhodocollybia butyracea]